MKGTRQRLDQLFSSQRRRDLLQEEPKGVEGKVYRATGDEPAADHLGNCTRPTWRTDMSTSSPARPRTTPSTRDSASRSRSRYHSVEAIPRSLSSLTSWSVNLRLARPPTHRQLPRSQAVLTTRRLQSLERGNSRSKSRFSFMCAQCSPPSAPHFCVRFVRR